MANDGVIANPADVRKLASALKKYQNEVKAASRGVQKALASANWHDSQKERFEQRYKDLQRSVDRFTNDEVTQMVKTLNELARRLDDIRRMRM